MDIKSATMTQMRHRREANVDLVDSFNDRDGFATHFVNEETAEDAYFQAASMINEDDREAAEKLAAILLICDELDAFETETSWSASALRSLANKVRQKQRLLAEKKNGKDVKKKMDRLHLSIDNLIRAVVCAAPGLDKLVISDAVKAELDDHTARAIADPRIFSKMQAELSNWLIRVGLEKREGTNTPRRNQNNKRGAAKTNNGGRRDVNGRKRNGGNSKRKPVKASALTGLWIQELDNRGRKVKVPARRLPSGEIVRA